MSDVMFTDWRKSSFSFANGNCGEVAALDGAVGVRDSKLGTSSPVLKFSSEAWRQFLAETGAGTLKP